MVEFINSSDLISIYKDDFNFKVYAGPGAGKTYFLVQNIKDIIENSKKLRENNIRKILCITYTNVAVNEIKSRLGHYNDYVEIKTIHSFLYEHVINPYQQQLKLIINKTFNANISPSRKLYPRAEGFGLLARLKISDFKNYLLEKYQILLANEVTKKKISDCVLDISSLNNYPFNENNEPIIKSVKFLSNNEDLLKLKAAIWETEGVLDFDEILYFSYILLKKYKYITYDIQYRFPYILIDEYQDTNPIQNKIIELISDKKITVGVVGDIAQSIYGFIKSNYREFNNFHPNVKDFKVFAIAGNRRSNSNIVHLLNYIRCKDETLNEQYCLINENKEKVKFVLCNKDNIDILKKLNEPDIRVLCRRWADAFEYITNINDDQRVFLKAVHNYYRYSMDVDLVNEFANSNINWINNVKIIISIYNSIKVGNFGGVLLEIEKIFDINMLKHEKRAKGIELIEIIKFVELFKNFTEDTTYKNIIISINNFIKTSSLQSKGFLELIEEENEYYINKFHPYLNNLTLKTLKVMYEEVFTDESKYLTIHKTKGKEYDNVLVNMTPIKEETILNSILDVLENPIIFSDEINDNITEFVRIAYVAFSRAKNKLYIHLHNTKDEIQSLLKILKKYCDDKKIEKFYEIIDLNDN